MHYSDEATEADRQTDRETIRQASAEADRQTATAGADWWT